MARTFLVLLLAVAVGIGFVGNGPDPCTADECGSGAVDDEHGAGDSDDGADDCPPFCGGCLRLAADATQRVALIDVVQHAELDVMIAPGVPPAAPPLSGLFRPPRA